MDKGRAISVIWINMRHPARNRSSVVFQNKLRTIYPFSKVFVTLPNWLITKHLSVRNPPKSTTGVYPVYLHIKNYINILNHSFSSLSFFAISHTLSYKNTHFAVKWVFEFWMN
jgi:hypothetical protein